MNDAGDVVAETHVKYNYTTYKSAQKLQIPFQAPGRKPCSILAIVEPNDNPEINGCGNLGLGPASRAKGFPTINITVSSPEFKGYGALYGWVQVISETKQQLPSNVSSASWSMDPAPIHKGVNTPFTWFGYEPTLFDAPIYDRHHEVDWVARSFLCYIPDELETRHLRPLIALEWGFFIEDNQPHIKELMHIDTKAWNDHLALLRYTFKDWTFDRKE